MLIRKIILKDDCGAPKGVATVKAEGASLALSLTPKGRLLLALSEERVLTLHENADGSYTLPAGMPLTLLAEIGGERTFGTETAEKSVYMKWRAEALLREKDAVTEKSVTQSEISEETIAEKTEETTPAPEALPEEQTEPKTVPPAPEKSDDESAEPTQDPFAEGEPFPYFERLIEGSRWVKILEGGYLLGTFRDGAQEVRMVGVPGHLGTAPDDSHEWEYIPSEDGSEDVGYYVRTESSEDFV